MSTIDDTPLPSVPSDILVPTDQYKDLRKLLNGIGASESSPSPLHTDSQSARDVSYNPEHHDP